MIRPQNLVSILKLDELALTQVTQVLALLLQDIVHLQNYTPH